MHSGEAKHFWDFEKCGAKMRHYKSDGSDAVGSDMQMTLHDSLATASKDFILQYCIERRSKSPDCHSNKRSVTAAVDCFLARKV